MWGELASHKRSLTETHPPSWASKCLVHVYIIYMYVDLSCFCLSWLDIHKFSTLLVAGLLLYTSVSP